MKKTLKTILLVFIFLILFLSSCSTIKDVYSFREKKMKTFIQENSFLTQVVKLFYVDGQYSIESLSKVNVKSGSVLLFSESKLEINKNMSKIVGVNLAARAVGKTSTFDFETVAQWVEAELFFLVGMPISLIENDDMYILEAYTQKINGSITELAFSNDNNYAISEGMNIEGNQLLTISNNNFICAYAIKDTVSNITYIVVSDSIQQKIPNDFLDSSKLNNLFYNYSQNSDKIIIPESLLIYRITPLENLEINLNLLQDIMPLHSRKDGKYTEIVVPGFQQR